MIKIKSLSQNVHESDFVAVQSISASFKYFDCHYWIESCSQLSSRGPGISRSCAWSGYPSDMTLPDWIQDKHNWTHILFSSNRSILPRRWKKHVSWPNQFCVCVSSILHLEFDSKMTLHHDRTGADYFCGGVLESNQTSIASNTSAAAAAAYGTGYWDNTLKVVLKRLQNIAYENCCVCPFHLPSMYTRVLALSRLPTWNYF